MESIPILPMSVEECISHCIREKYEKYGLEKAFPNRLLRGDVLDLLDMFCTVVYYPLENEKNNGFHVTDMPFANGEKQNFVFINTAQTMEKQIFTAAHELGHIWAVDDYVIEKLRIDDTPKIREMIINRFAAVLLIPEKPFRETFDRELQKYASPEKTVTVLNVYKIIVIMMNKFLAPMKSIILRLYELNLLNKETIAFLLGKGTLGKTDIEKLIKILIKDFGYVTLLNPSNKKYIDGLADKLDIAEKRHLIPQIKIDHMREKFGLNPPVSITREMDNTISLTSQEGLDT